MLCIEMLPGHRAEQSSGLENGIRRLVVSLHTIGLYPFQLLFNRHHTTDFEGT